VGKVNAVVESETVLIVYVIEEGMLFVEMSMLLVQRMFTSKENVVSVS
jgi:hypothetical protein